MITKILSFSRVLAITLFAAIIIQNLVFKQQFIAATKLSYLGNYFVSVFIFLIIILKKDSHTNLLGFFFLAGSLFKFLLFFLFLYPKFTADALISKNEITTFFIPYTISVVIELRYLIKELSTE